MVDVITIAGSPSVRSRSAAVLEHLRQNLEHQGLRTRGLNVRDLPPEDLIYGHVESPAIQEWVALLSEARGVIVGTPIYKAAYSGVLKAFLDLLPQRALADKLVLPIATGGSPVHMLAIDYALRPVLTSLGALNVLSGVYITDNQLQYDGDALRLDPEILPRVDGALQGLIDGLLSSAIDTNSLPTHVAMRTI